MSRPAKIALALSFIVYVLPVFNVHAGYIPWPAMYFGDIFGNVAFSLLGALAALILQALAWLAFYHLLRRFHWTRLIGVAALFPVLFFAVNVTFLYAVPLVVLIAPDWSEDVGELERVCQARDVSLMQVHTGVSLALEKSGTAWVRKHDLSGAEMLTMPDCRLQSAGDFSNGNFRSVNAAGEVLFGRYDGTLVLGRVGATPPRQLSPPGVARDWQPILTVAGGQLAWLERGPPGEKGRPHLIRLRDVPPPHVERTIRPDVPARSSLRLLEAAPPLFTLARDRREIIVVDDKGAVVWGPVSPQGVAGADEGFRRVGRDGWVAWDQYREDGRYRLVWSLPGGSGDIAMPRGRSIESIAVSPDGRHIAYSTEGNSYFSVEGRLVIVKSADASVVYRRRLPQFARLQLAFLGNDHLAFRDYDGEAGDTAVYRLRGE